MDYSNAFAISAAGMSVERLRVDTAAINLANSNTVQGADGSAYRPLRVLIQPSTEGTVGAYAGASRGTSFASQFANQLGDSASTARLLGNLLPTATLETTTAAPRRVYEPGHPFADEKGFITYPGVDSAVEMMTLMSALRDYEANVAAMNTSRMLALKTLDIGGGA